MITNLQQNLDNRKKSIFLKSDFNKSLFDNNQIKEYQNGIWFKGSRYR